VVQYVNANPTILNKDYKGNCDEAEGKFKISEFAKKLDLKARKDPYPQDAMKYDLFKLKSHLQFVKPKTPFIVTSGNRVHTPFGLELTPGVSLLRGQIGGHGMCHYIKKKIAEKDTVIGADLIHNYMEVMLKQLEARNKKLSSKDRVHIDERIKKLKDIENEMLRTLCYIEEYNKLLDVFKDYKSATLSLDHLEKFISRHDGLMDKQQTTESSLLEILTKIRMLIDKESKDYVPIKV
jgi:hypothetical protein